MSNKFKLAMCQILVGADKAVNLANARKAVKDAAAKGANLVSLPECFNSPYDTSCFPEYAEVIPASADEVKEGEHPSSAMLISAAKESSVYLIGGSFPEKDKSGKVFNTCLIVSPEGKFLGKHRKMHLFDIDVPGKITFKESDTLTAGNQVTCFDTPYCKIGVAICYDIRFPHLAMLMRDAGCSVLLYPGAFNTTTGPAHWELLQRARAVDTQSFVATASPARNPDSKYQAWGHSSIINPWGEVVATCDHDPATIVAEVDLEKVKEMRENIPTSKQLRTDIYNPVSLKQ